MPRLRINKTYKLYIGGQFPRTESGRYYAISNKKGVQLANICLASKKDLRDAVMAARKAQPGWQSKSAMNRGQILYRMAEMVESKRASFIEELMALGHSKSYAQTECNLAIDTLVYYAGWCDKYSSVFSAVNPVASSYFSFSNHEPVGVVCAVADENRPLLGCASIVASVLCGGNSIILLASQGQPTCALSFADVVHSSDVPAGVVNILSGKLDELLPQMASHKDIDTLIVNRAGIPMDALLEVSSSIKRLVNWNGTERPNDPYRILDTQELKTTWHPIQTSLQNNSTY